MRELGIKQKDMEHDLGINHSSISLWLTGTRAMTKPVQAMFYYYLRYKEHERAGI